MTRYTIRGPLTHELGLKDSPIREFFDDRMLPGLKAAQAAYRSAAGQIVVPGAPREEADPGTIGTAADWLLRFLTYPTPSLRLAAYGAGLCGMMPAVKELAATLGYRDAGHETFLGPSKGSGVEPELLHRACWALALLTEVYRRGPQAAALGPLGSLPERSAAALLSAATDAALDQLAQIGAALESALLPAIQTRTGPWALGPVFAGSEIMKADADLIADGLLVEFKTTVKKPSLGITELWQVLGYALMDYTDEFGITDVAIFQGRYSYLAVWNLDELVTQLAGIATTASELRAEFRTLLETCRP